MKSSSYEKAMSLTTVDDAITPLEFGDVLPREEFLRRWENMPRLGRAELIKGMVYMPSPISREHGVMESNLSGWLSHFVVATVGCEAANNATWFMGEDAPQPDVSLRILPEYGGTSQMRGRYLSGAPEFLVEVCVTSAAYDLHQKLDAYQEAGVQEYVAVLMHEREVRLHRLTGGRFEVVPPPTDGVHRSAVFPGLWLDAPALLAGDLARVFAMLSDGISSPEHQQFVEQLAARRRT